MSILSDEITNDPTGKGYSNFLPDQPGHVVNLLNTKTESMIGVIARSNLTTWAAITNMRGVIEDLSINIQSPLRSSALAILDVLKGSSDGIDLAKTSNALILTSWVASGVLSEVDRDSMLTLAMQPTSRAEVLGLPYITEELLRNR